MYYAIPEGSNYAVYSSNGTRVSTTSAAGLVAFGLSTSNLGSKPATATTPTQTTTPTSTTTSNVNTGRTQVTLGNGTTVWYDSAGQAYDANGNKVSNTSIASSTATNSPSISNTSSSQNTSSFTGLQPNGTTWDGYTTYAIPAGYNIEPNTTFTYNGATYARNGDVIIQMPQYGSGTQYGFRDISSYSTTPSTAGTSQSSTQATQNTQSASNALTYNPAWSTYGLSQDQWNQLNSTQQAVIGAALNVAQNNYATNASKITLSDALAAAAKDPNLVAKYADAAKIDQTQFQQGLQQLQQSTSLTSQQQQQQFENERKQLAEQQGAAGTAYSGFRGEAQKQLGQTESGIVQSSRAQLQKQLNDATQAFEAKYGTAATTPATLQYASPDLSSNYTLSGLYKPQGTSLNTLTGSTVGGITGSQPIQKQQDINSLAGQYVQVGQMPSPTPIS